MNTAGIRWLRRSKVKIRRMAMATIPIGTSTTPASITISTGSNKVSFSGTWERDSAETSQAGLTNWPGGYDGLVSRKPRVITASFVSTVSPTIVNEFRFGTRKAWNYSWSSIWRPDAVGAAARAMLPTHGGKAFYPTQALIRQQPH